ncbi:MAG: ATP-binding cassette domain-containing protein [Pseudomonadota bacterium]
MSTGEEPIVVVEELRRRFGDNEVLKGIDLPIPEGLVTVIIGASGSGKSVLVKHIIGLLLPTSGRILFRGNDVTSMSRRARDRIRHHFGMLFQHSALFDSMSVEENIAFPLVEHTRKTRKEIRRVVAEKLELLGLSGIERMNPSDLSGGMRKRVGLARAIVLNPDVLIYDEPTTGLDPITTIQVDRMIKEAQQKLHVTSVVISHDMASTFRIADQVAMIHDGRIVERCPPDAFRVSAKPEVREFLMASSLGGDGLALMEREDAS